MNNKEYIMKVYKLKKYCQYNDCYIISSFNYPGCDSKIFCKKHKLNGMILKRSKTCLKCNKYPTFNYNNSTCGLYCKVHKLENMVAVVNTCIYKDCNKQAQYNYKNYKDKKFLYCKKHKLDNMVNIRILEYKN